MSRNVLSAVLQRNRKVAQERPSYLDWAKDRMRSVARQAKDVVDRSPGIGIAPSVKAEPKPESAKASEGQKIKDSGPKARVPTASGPKNTAVTAEKPKDFEQQVTENNEMLNTGLNRITETAAAARGIDWKTPLVAGLGGSAAALGVYGLYRLLRKKRQEA